MASKYGLTLNEKMVKDDDEFENSQLANAATNLISF